MEFREQEAAPTSDLEKIALGKVIFDDDPSITSYTIDPDDNFGILSEAADDGKIRGYLFPKKEFDREEQETYNVEIRSMSSGSIKSQQSVKIRLIDINDNNPEFLDASMTMHIDEITDGRSTGVKLGEITAVDDDTKRITAWNFAFKPNTMNQITYQFTRRNSGTIETKFWSEKEQILELGSTKNARECSQCPTGVKNCACADIMLKKNLRKLV
jgi:hypothetical protein